MKDLILVGVAAGLGGIILGKWLGPIESKLIGMGIPPAVGHFTMVAGTAVGVYYVGRRVL